MNLKPLLDPIKKRLALATPGPWYPCGCRYTMISRDLSETEIEDIAEVCNHFRDESQVEMNKQFIANSPTDIKKLIEAVEILALALESIGECEFKQPTRGIAIESLTEAAKVLEEK